MSLCEEVIDLEHLEQTRQVRVRPSFHEELNRLGHELDRAREDMFGVLRDVERESKVPNACCASGVTPGGVYITFYPNDALLRLFSERRKITLVRSGGVCSITCSTCVPQVYLPTTVF